MCLFSQINGEYLFRADVSKIRLIFLWNVISNRETKSMYIILRLLRFYEDIYQLK